MSEQRSANHEKWRNSLPDDLRSVFDDFVADYKFAGVKHHGAPYISYAVLAEMVRLGWRLYSQDGGGSASAATNAE